MTPGPGTGGLQMRTALTNLGPPPASGGAIAEVTAR